MVLLHSLRRLMVEVPQFEDILGKWTATKRQKEIERGSEKEMERAIDVPMIGCECGLLAQELRSQFTSAIILTSQKLMYTLSYGCNVNFAALLCSIDQAFPEGTKTMFFFHFYSIHRRFGKRNSKNSVHAL